MKTFPSTRGGKTIFSSPIANLLLTICLFHFLLHPPLELSPIVINEVSLSGVEAMKSLATVSW